MARLTFETTPSLRKIERILDLLKFRDYSVLELAPLIPITDRWLVDYLNHIKSNNQIHICGYMPEVEGIRRYPRPVYRLGPGVDAPRPAPLTDKQRKLRRKRRMKRDDDYFFIERSKTRLRKFIPKPDKAAAWLFAQ
jgi:hypothetical protein